MSGLKETPTELVFSMYNFIAIKGGGVNTLCDILEIASGEKWLRMQAKVERLYNLRYFLMQGWEKKSLGKYGCGWRGELIVKNSGKKRESFRVM